MRLNAGYFFSLPLWKWAVTSADYNTELKLWSCEKWECHQTIKFQSSDGSPLVQKMAMDLSASFLLISDIYRKVKGNCNWSCSFLRPNQF